MQRKIIALVVGIIVAGLVVIASGNLDTTRDIDYMKQELPENTTAIAADNRTIYICNNPESKLYHRYKDCEELQKCINEIAEAKIADAEAADRVLCSICNE